MPELLGIVVFLLIGPALGFGAGYVLSQHLTARDLARLRELVPSPGLLRDIAQVIENESWTLAWPQYRMRVLERTRQLRELARRIEGERERLSLDEVQRPSRDGVIATYAGNDDEAEIANQCKSCLDYIIPRVEWHCASHEEPPVGRCGDWKGAG